MKRDPKGRSGHCRTGLCVVVVVAALAQPSHAQPQPGADASKPKDSTRSSYDQIAPVLLGKESFQAVMARDKADKATGHGPPEEAPGGALRPHPAARRQADHVARQADPGRPDRQAAGGNDLGATGRDVQRRDPRQGTVSQGISAVAPSQARGRRHGLPPDGDQAAAAPGALRHRFRLARALPARVPAGHLPDDAVRPGRRLAGQGRDRRQLPGDLRAAS